MRVDFMVIGAQKCGTSSLAMQLAAHPEICFSRIKEPGYFNQTEDWQADLESYHSLFTPGEGQICGESSTMHTFLPEWLGTHQRLHAYNPDLKLIYIMRQPVERIVSNYAHRVVRRTVEGPPETAVCANPAYISRSRYGVQIRPYIELFGRDRIMLLIFEEYIADQPATLAKIASFLGISPQAFPAEQESVALHPSTGRWYVWPSLNKLTYSPAVRRTLDLVPLSLRKSVRRQIGARIEEKPEFSPLLREALWRMVEDDVETIEGLLGRRLDVWRQGYDRPAP